MRAYDNTTYMSCMNNLLNNVTCILIRTSKAHSLSALFKLTLPPASLHPCLPLSLPPFPSLPCPLSLSNLSFNVTAVVKQVQVSREWLFLSKWTRGDYTKSGIKAPKKIGDTPFVTMSMQSAEGLPQVTWDVHAVVHDTGYNVDLRVRYSVREWATNVANETGSDFFWLRENYRETNTSLYRPLFCVG